MIELTDELREAMLDTLTELAEELVTDPNMKQIPENFVINDRRMSVSKARGQYFFQFKLEILNNTPKKK